MNNNNMYFSCFSLIRACVSSLFANFYKVVCVCLVVCFALCSPVASFASTTESMMMFSTGSVSDEYAVMPLAAVDAGLTLTTGAGYYDLAADDWIFSNPTTVSNPFRTFAAWPSFGFTTSKSTYVAGYYTLTGSAMPTVGDSWRIVCDNYRLVLYLDLDGDGTTEKFIPMTDNAVPFISEVEIAYTGTVRIQNSDAYFGHSDTVVIPFSSLFNGTGVYTWNKSGDISLTFSMPDSPVQASFGGQSYTCDWVSADVTSITFRTCYAINSSNYDLANYSYSIGDSIQSQFGWDDTRIYIIESEGTLSNESSVISAGLQSVNTSINNLGSSMSNQITNVNNNINQVKTQLTQSTNTITTKIDTMANDVKSGLQNVVTSAQQNTQNIINTVTTKVDEVKTGITEVKDSILDLPNKLQEMLTEFIVPDAETMGGKYSEFTELLEEKLGVIYQIPAMILELFETLVSGVTDPQTTLTFPSLSLPWIDGTQMKLWDSIEFEIIPTGMDVLKELIQTVTSMVCVIMTFNSVKRIYENFLRGR